MNTAQLFSFPSSILSVSPTSLSQSWLDPLSATIVCCCVCGVCSAYQALIPNPLSGLLWLWLKCSCFAYCEWDLLCFAFFCFLRSVLTRPDHDICGSKLFFFSHDLSPASSPHTTKLMIWFFWFLFEISSLLCLLFFNFHLYSLSVIFFHNYYKI